MFELFVAVRQHNIHSCTTKGLHTGDVICSALDNA